MTDVQPKRHVPGILKFNSGIGALLCPECRLIVAIGFEHLGKAYDCKGCPDVTVTSDKGMYVA